MRTKRYVTPADDRRRNGPVQVAKPAPEAWALALAKADGDASRLRTLDDGSVVVSNRSNRRASCSPFTRGGTP